MWSLWIKLHWHSGKSPIMTVCVSSVRCARPAARGTSVTCWCRGTRAAPSSPLLWSARAGGFDLLGHWAASPSSSSSSQPDGAERETLHLWDIVDQFETFFWKNLFDVKNNLDFLILWCLKKTDACECVYFILRDKIKLHQGVSQEGSESQKWNLKL